MQFRIVFMSGAMRVPVEADLRRLIGAYPYGTLSPAEDRCLYEAAVSDQGLFDALAEEDLLREVLENEAFRERLKTRLHELRGRPSRGWVAGLGTLLMRPVVLFAISAAVVVLVCATGALMLTRSESDQWRKATGSQPAVRAKGLPVFEPSFVSADTLKGEFLDRLWETAGAGTPTGAALVIGNQNEGSIYKKGDLLHITFSLPHEGAAVLLSKGPDGSVTQLFPNMSRTLSHVRANEWIEIPGSGEGIWRVEGPVGEYRLRLVVFPLDADPLQAGTPGAERPIAIEGRYRVVDRSWLGN